MALDNLISVKFTADELARMDAAMSEVENIMKNKAVNLTSKQRQLYGRVAYEMETWVGKTFNYMQQDPQLVPPFIDMVEHTADMIAHQALNPRIERLNGILQSMQDTNRLLGSDIYNNSLAYYRNLREAAKVNAIGATAKLKDLKRQFPTGKKSSASKEEEE
ncbi:MAG: hypothetical protein LBT50_11855 [Prevotellaceae bacterium]|jgi:hypothetical protein|nr:hypothetical protein [Prevotellaceae bacterium]